METISRYVSDLDRSDRSALECVIGHSLDAAQEVTIQISGSPIKTHGQVAIGDLPAWCNVYEGLTDAEIDDLDRSIVRLPGSRVF